MSDVEPAPPQPPLVLAAAILFPGAGHAAIGLWSRAAGFLFFALLLAAATWAITTPDKSMIGRTAGGLFVWAMSIPDAYRLAKIRHVAWRRRNQT